MAVLPSSNNQKTQDECSPVPTGHNNSQIQLNSLAKAREQRYLRNQQHRSRDRSSSNNSCSRSFIDLKSKNLFRNGQQRMTVTKINQSEISRKMGGPTVSQSFVAGLGHTHNDSMDHNNSVTQGTFAVGNTTFDIDMVDAKVEIMKKDGSTKTLRELKSMQNKQPVFSKKSSKSSLLNQYAKVASNLEIIKERGIKNTSTRSKNHMKSFITKKENFDDHIEHNSVISIEPSRPIPKPRVMGNKKPSKKRINTAIDLINDSFTGEYIVT